MAEAIKGESDSYVQSSSGRTRKRGHFGTFRAFPVLISGVGRLIAFVDNQVVAGPTIENIKPTINFKPSVLDNRSIVARKDYIYIYIHPMVCLSLSRAWSGFLSSCVPSTCLRERSKKGWASEDAFSRV